MLCLVNKCECGCGQECGNRFVFNHHRSKPAAERFWAFVAKGGYGECWLWTGYLTEDGYGRFVDESGKTELAHRFSWRLKHRRAIGRRMEILHSCDMPPCVNPSHLSENTHAANMRDAIKKGRWSPSLPGERNPSAKLSRAQVAEIRGLIAGGLAKRAIARQYGVSDTLIRKIDKKEVWNVS